MKEWDEVVPSLASGPTKFDQSSGGLAGLWRTRHHYAAELTIPGTLGSGEDGDVEL